jgi:hypothetical protein
LKKKKIRIKIKLPNSEDKTGSTKEIFISDKNNLTAVNLSVIIEIVCIFGKIVLNSPLYHVYRKSGNRLFSLVSAGPKIWD